MPPDDHSDPGASGSSPPPAARPLPLSLALLLLLVQAAAIGAAGVVLVLDLFQAPEAGAAHVPALKVGGIAVFALGTAALLVLGALAARRGRRWVRGPLVTSQLLLAAVGFAQLPFSVALGTGMMVLGAATTVMLLLPSSRAAMDGAGGPGPTL